MHHNNEKPREQRRRRIASSRRWQDDRRIPSCWETACTSATKAITHEVQVAARRPAIGDSTYAAGDTQQRQFRPHRSRKTATSSSKRPREGQVQPTTKRTWHRAPCTTTPAPGRPDRRIDRPRTADFAPHVASHRPTAEAAIFKKPPACPPQHTHTRPQ
ncbi:uncharacterized protein LOC119766406 [Culex quinquefasciatus]|uniref:uncharacterized protein LOC119766406 n=1 Tax=Culex quinquefasciatus TaxID=7176 RepID=UPI0018E2D7F0|nr:uncharacterized protein LOC119766406 [Culex quinquefasciatus]